nr:loricrin isoform X1 [Osmia lignaria]
MLCRKVVVVLLVCLFSIVCGMPHTGDNSQDSSGLPFIQFTNGGIRLNFGGYHAAAGLGGLLGGSRAGGGLHASAGTPWGAHAGAGLGGILGGDNANAGGGLYARAGLGNGRSEVAAGLGGVLDGSGSTPSGGGLYAGASMGGHGVGVSTGNVGGGSNGPSESNNAPSSTESTEGKSSKGTSNIQIISHPGRKPHKIKQALDESSGSNEASKQVVPAAHKELREVQPTQSPPSAPASIFETFAVNPVPQAFVGKVKIVGGVIPEAPPVPPLPSQVNEVVQIEHRPHRVKLVYPKWVVRKRFWGPRKQIIINSSVESQETPETNAHKISRRQIPNYNNNRPVSGQNGVPVQNGNNSGFFDDIFQIPVSTLNAVNQFLNNNTS